MVANSSTAPAAALTAALERGIVAQPRADDLWAVYNAQPLENRQLKQHLYCEQGFRPVFNELVKARYEVVPEFSGEEPSFDGAILFTQRHSKLNETGFARAWNGLTPGNIIVVAGEKTTGIDPLLKRVSAKFGHVEKYAKYRAKLFWLERFGEAKIALPPPRLVQGYQIGDGMFSADGPDTGSKLLCHHFSDRIRGEIADFGAGWGYLGGELLAKSSNVDRLDCYEADWRSLALARENLQSRAGKVVLGFEWIDIATEPINRHYDWILMNPPFHIGRAASPALGKAFIEKAAAILKPGGRLLMVANKSLPYEQSLRARFRQVNRLQVSAGYKVIEAQR